METTTGPESDVMEKPLHFTEDSQAHAREYARALDNEDPLKKFADEFRIPSKANLLAKKLNGIGIHISYSNSLL